MIKPSAFLKCLFGPKLVRIYVVSGLKAGNYFPNTKERLGDGLLKLIDWSIYIGIYTSPLLLGVLYKRSYLTSEGLHAIIKFTGFVAALTASSLIIRAYGRCTNPTYISFIEQYKLLTSKPSPTHNRKLAQMFDYEFSAWPVDYEVPRNVQRNFKSLDLEKKPTSVIENLTQLIGKVFGYLVAHSFGIRLLYPGTIIQNFIEPHLVEGRAKMIEQEGAERYKLLAQDGNAVDTIFLDRRKSGHDNGKYLVVCCEGNAGFYEVGMISTPVDAEYSVLGWNHPGFGGSSGSPFPEQEQNAVDAVMQFAINSLGFPADKIVVYGWSIGGFTASWVAMNYPEIHAVLLDATFDNVFHLAANVMPPSWEVLVDTTIRHHLNLNVAKQLVKYQGPVLLFRRTQDEVISLVPGKVGTNRGNDLLIYLLKARYPSVVDDSTIPALQEWLKADVNTRLALVRIHNVSREKCAQVLQKHMLQNPESFPSSIGEGWDEAQKKQFALFLADRYMWDFDSTHCTPLPVEMFRLPQEHSKELYISKK